MFSPATTLYLVKIVHTVVWAFFVTCIVAIPVAAQLGRFRAAVVFTLVVLGEVAVLGLNRMRCPLTDVAGRYTDERADNFDIYLPLWLARHNKTIFGWLFVIGVVFAIVRWWASRT